MLKTPLLLPVLGVENEQGAANLAATLHNVILLETTGRDVHDVVNLIVQGLGCH